MPADTAAPPKPINREAVKVLCQAIGIREGARRMGLDEHRVLKWSQRDPAGPWIATRVTVPERTITVQPVSSCPQPVISASDALAAANLDNSRRGRAATLRAGAAVLEHVASVAENDPEAALVRGGEAKAWVDNIAKAGAWGDSDKGRVRVSIFAGIGSAVQVVSDK